MERVPVEVGERTSEIYERIAGYEEASPVPLPEPGDLDSLTEVGFKLSPRSRRVIDAILSLSGFKAFEKELPETAEDLFRHQDLRAPALFAPVSSATLALADDARNLAPADRAATLVLAARALRDDLYAGRLKQDRHRHHPLEMGQYPNLFSTCIVLDRAGRPRIFKTKKLSQLTVVVGRRIYLLEVGDLQSATRFAELAEAFVRLAALGRTNRLTAFEPSPGLLTAAGDSTQSRIFRRLQKVPDNAESLAAVRHSFLTVCLDLDSRPSSYAEAIALAHSGNYANRWYHSSLQLVVFGNGKACAICNFGAYLDGNTMMRGVAEVQKRAARVSAEPRSDRQAAGPYPVRELLWQIDPRLYQKAQEDLSEIRDEQRATFEIPDLGRRFFAAHGVEPVPAFVVALEMAAQRLTGDPVKIAQFLTMSKYRCSDLRLAQVGTPEVLRLIEYLDGGDVDEAQARALLREAISSQRRACDQQRRSVALQELVLLYLRSRRGGRRRFVAAVLALGLKLLGRLRIYQPVPHDVLLSHPESWPEVPLVGRPGVRLPYVSCFGLHYQILEDHIVVTVMPSVVWTIPNVELISVLTESLERIRSLIATPPPG